MLLNHLRVLYLHGFASSPASRKAQFFAAELRAQGFPVEIPDLAEGRFEALTISRQLGVIERAVAGEPVILVGSSLGGYLAALYAAAHPEEVRKLVLLAPAFGFHQLWTTQIGPQRLQEWRKVGAMPILHYGEGRELTIGYQLIEEASTYPAFPDFTQPALIFHGTEDPVVPVQHSVAFAESHRNVKLVMFPAGHELTDVLYPMWLETQAFLLD